MKIAEEIETLEMNKEEINRYFNAKAQADKKTKEEEEDSDFDEEINENKAANTINHRADLIDTVMFNDDLDSTQNQHETEQKMLMENYYVTNGKADLMNVTLASLENHPTIKNHIVVCGIHSAIKSFIMPLRKKYLKEY